MDGGADLTTPAAKRQFCTSMAARMSSVRREHTCVESTVRFAVELGYDVTVAKDATADYSEEFMRAALVTNLPNYASAIVTTQEVTDALLGDRPLPQSEMTY
jgi:hypothetical protein